MNRVQEKPAVGTRVQWDTGLLGWSYTQFGVVERHTLKQIRVRKVSTRHVNEQGNGCYDSSDLVPQWDETCGEVVCRYKEDGGISGWYVYEDGRAFPLRLYGGAPGTFTAYY